MPNLAKIMGLSVNNIDYVKLLDKAVESNDYIVGAYEDGKITKIFLQNADLGGLGHKSFLEGREVGFGVGKYEGSVYVRTSGTNSLIGGRKISQEETDALKKLFEN